MAAQPEIGAEAVGAYGRDGAVCLRGVIGRDWTDRLLAAIDAAVATNVDKVSDYSAARDRGFVSSSKMSRRDEAIRDFTRNSPLPYVASRLMRVDRVRFFYDQIFIKEPGTSEKTKWHQDLPFWPFRGNDIVSLWVALTPVSLESSGVEYIAGSHKWAKFYEADFSDQMTSFLNSGLEKCPDFDLRRDDASLRFLNWPLEPGDVVAHHPLTVHGAGGNRSSELRRVGISARYFGDDVRWDPRPLTGHREPGLEIRPGEYPANDTFYPVVWPPVAP